MTPPLVFPISNRSSPPSRFLNLPVDIRTLVFHEIFLKAIHVEAHSARPTVFRHYLCDDILSYRFFDKPDLRKTGCAAIMMGSYYDEVYEEDKDKITWYSIRSSRWRNHWVCEFGYKRVRDKEHGWTLTPARSASNGTSNFLANLLACRQLYALYALPQPCTRPYSLTFAIARYFEAVSVIGAHVRFTFTDLWTPVEFFKDQARGTSHSSA